MNLGIVSIAKIKTVVKLSETRDSIRVRANLNPLAGIYNTFKNNLYR